MKRISRNKCYLLISLFCFSFLAVFSQNNFKLNSEVEKLKKDASLSHAQWSVCVMNIKKDSTLFEYNSNTSLIPASTLKVLTTGAALNILGSDFRFETKIEYDGIFDSVSGILHGNLYITGGGDPTLESEYFKDKKDSVSAVEKWATIIKEKGIKKIEGAIVADASIFDENTTPSQWIWADMGNYYGAGASGLTYRDNKITLYFKSGVENSLTEIKKVVPQISDLKIINNVKAGGKKDNAFVYASPYSYRYLVEGSVPTNQSNYEVDALMPDPALFCAQQFYEAVLKKQISVSKKFTTYRILSETQSIKKTERKTIYSHYSPTLDKIVYYTNLKSNNLYAEHLLKYVCYKKTGYGNEHDATEIITNYWKNRGVDVAGFFMNDGCGLARSNVITTKTQTQVLKILYKDKVFSNFYNSLPIAGKSGSLGGLCDGTFAENNLRAKSGYITRARGYCGYVKNKKGEMLCFSVLANNYDCSASEMKNKLEKILVAIAEME